MAPRGEIRFFADLEALSRAAADIFVAQAARSTAARGRFAVALAGGATPRRTYELLAAEPLREQVNWQQVHIFWGDERGVPPEDRRSNYRLAKQTLLERVPLPSENIHSIPAYPSVELGARKYEAELKAFFGQGLPQFDLIFLGLGADGHVASLFPGSPLLREKRRWVVGIPIANRDEARVTLTAAVINLATMVVFLVAGKDKAEAVKDVFEGPLEPWRHPAQLIHPASQGLVWLLD
ncbi:MAG: 6-phosphogluconolactonase [Desulfobaccales bacterium]